MLLTTLQTIITHLLFSQKLQGWLFLLVLLTALILSTDWRFFTKIQHWKRWTVFTARFLFIKHKFCSQLWCLPTLSKFCGELIRFMNYCRHPLGNITMSFSIRFLIFIVANCNLTNPLLLSVAQSPVGAASAAAAHSSFHAFPTCQIDGWKCKFNSFLFDLRT